jgi:hypothetical protein
MIRAIFGMHIFMSQRAIIRDRDVLRPTIRFDAKRRFTERQSVGQQSGFRYFHWDRRRQLDVGSTCRRQTVRREPGKLRHR